MYRRVEPPPSCVKNIEDLRGCSEFTSEKGSTGLLTVSQLFFAVIPAKGGNRWIPGCRIKSGMTAIS
jgi:hypothetical protein